MIEVWQTHHIFIFTFSRNFSYELNNSGGAAEQKITPSVNE